MNDRQRDNHSNKAILNGIVIEGEKCFLFDDRKRSSFFFSI